VARSFTESAGFGGTAAAEVTLRETNNFGRCQQLVSTGRRLPSCRRAPISGESTTTTTTAEQEEEEEQRAHLLLLLLPNSGALAQQCGSSLANSPERTKVKRH
jgi:hypothetical protein